MMRRLRAVSFLLAIWAVAAMAPTAARGADPPAGNAPGIAGLFVTTKYPALSVRAGETTTVDVSVRNFKLPPQSLTLSVPQVETGARTPSMTPSCRSPSRSARRCRPSSS
jgi:hypothetical protein